MTAARGALLSIDLGSTAVKVLIADVESGPSTDNPKGALQEVLQAISSEAPQYQVLSATGPDHDRNFECAVFYKGEEIGRGNGKSKKLAESQAAAVALERMRAQSAVAG